MIGSADSTGRIVDLEPGRGRRYRAAVAIGASTARADPPEHGPGGSRQMDDGEFPDRADRPVLVAPGIAETFAAGERIEAWFATPGSEPGRPTPATTGREPGGSRVNPPGEYARGTVAGPGTVGDEPDEAVSVVSSSRWLPVGPHPGDDGRDGRVDAGGQRTSKTTERSGTRMRTSRRRFCDRRRERNSSRAMRTRNARGSPEGIGIHLETRPTPPPDGPTTDTRAARGAVLRVEGFRDGR